MYNSYRPIDKFLLFLCYNTVCVLKAGKFIPKMFPHRRPSLQTIITLLEIEKLTKSGSKFKILLYANNLH